jgi:hypothetical protein
MVLDVASKTDRFVMRSLFSAAFVLALFASSASAEVPSRVTCRAFAQAAADDWSAYELARAEEGAEAGADEVVIIAAGEKYFVPRQSSDLIVRSVGTRIRDYKTVYRDEFHRCLRGGDITISKN